MLNNQNILRNFIDHLRHADHEVAAKQIYFSISLVKQTLKQVQGDGGNLRNSKQTS